MGFNLYELGIPYSMWSLILALAVPVIGAIACFACLHRAQTSRKLISYFVLTPIYFLSVAFISSDAFSLLWDRVLGDSGIFFPELVEFLVSICLSLLYFSLMSLICGVSVLRKRAAITNATATLICLALEVYIIYGTWSCFGLASMVSPSMPIPAASALPFLGSISFLPSAVTDIGIELYALLVFFIYLLVYFLSFIAIKSREEIERDIFERRRNASIKASRKHQSSKKRNPSFEADEPICALCQFSRKLLTEKGRMVCDKCGIVSTTHSCKYYIYDPLKRSPSRPSLALPTIPLSEEELSSIEDTIEPTVAPQAFDSTPSQELTDSTPVTKPVEPTAESESAEPTEK